MHILLRALFIKITLFISYYLLKENLFTHIESSCGNWLGSGGDATDVLRYNVRFPIGFLRG